MTTFPAAGHLTDPARLGGEVKADFEAWLQGTKELPGAASENALTIAGGSITPTAAAATVDTEASAAADDLTNAEITNHPAGRWLLLSSLDASRVPTVKHASGVGTGRFFMKDAADLPLVGPDISVLFVRRGNDWYEVLRDYGNQKAALRAFVGVASLATVDAATDTSAIVSPLQLGRLHKQGTAIASATNVAKPADADRGGRYHVTGTTTIATLWSTASFPWPVTLIFDGILTLTNSASLICLGNADITTAAGDIATLVPEAANVWRMVDYVRKNGTRLDVAQTFTSLQKFTQTAMVSQTLVDGATVNWVGSSGAVATVTLGGNRALANPSGLQTDGFYMLRVIQDATGGRVPTWGSNYKFKGGAAPTGSITANAVDIYVFYSPNGALMQEVGHNFDVR